MRKSKFILFFFYLMTINVFMLNAQNDKTCFEKRIHSNINKPLIMAHRMAPLKKGYAENSIETLIYNITHFPDAIQEIDVQTTADDEVVLLHDNTLERTSTGKGLINTYSYADLKKENLKDGCGNILWGQKIPLLKDALKVAKGKISIMLDVKPNTNINVVMDIVKQAKMFNDVCIICYSVEDGIKMNKEYPGLMIALGFNSYDDIKRIKKSGIPYNRLIALVPKIIQEKSFYDEIKKMRVPISFSAQACMDVMSDAPIHYRNISKEGITILCTDSILNVYKAIY